MKRIAVFCGSSSGHNDIYRQTAVLLGKYLVENRIGLVYGGGRVGLMGVLADTVMDGQGEVIGVIPNLLRHEEVAHKKITQMIVTRKMSKRKVKISKLVDGYIALPGGFGTMDELFEALTLGQLAIEEKPVGILNINGFFEPMLKQLELMVREGFLHPENQSMLLVSDSVEGLFKKMEGYKASGHSKIVEAGNQHKMNAHVSDKL